MGAVIGAIAAPFFVPVITGRPSTVARAISADLAHAPGDGVAAFYAQRGDEPLWVRHGRLSPAAEDLVSALNSAGVDDLDPANYQPSHLSAEIAAARSGDPARLAAADIDLSRAFAAYVGDLHRPPPAAALKYVDPAVPVAPTDPTAILAAAARAPSLTGALSQDRRMNPIYLGLRAALADARAHVDPKAALIEANLERARALPADLGDRYVVVNPAAEGLWFKVQGEPPRPMQVVIGTTDDQTPNMIGLIRFALFNPYWNVPPDIVRDKIAPGVLAQGPAYLDQERFEVLSDWSDHAQVVAPQAVDWTAVASGATPIRVRQKPYAENVMGQVKFMLPNPLGIYLHDTPTKGLFDSSVRTDSHGCVRLRDALQLAVWIFGHPVASGSSDVPDQRADVAPPIPVYILYLTAQPGEDGRIVFSPDVYGRDAALLASLRRPQASSALAPSQASRTISPAGAALASAAD